ncbi:MAG: hypothetical protein HQK58_15210 [Deltaproteobacteria bacterium]|nr:hypothetical protein [Deltaproteobacteria bacterium]MBF0525695.1 hypothetical protein [Deltaproteobacteria bacterium]
MRRAKIILFRGVGEDDPAVASLPYPLPPVDAYAAGAKVAIYPHPVLNPLRLCKTLSYFSYL